MSNIMVTIPNIEGEVEGDSAGAIQCDALRHAIELPVYAGTVRVEGTSSHGPVALTHAVDKATPPLRLAASLGTNLGTVNVKVSRVVEGGAQVVEQIDLENASVVRMELDTPLDPATLEPQDAPIETFYLEYSKITWTANKFESGLAAGSVSSAFDVTQQKSVG